MTRTELTRILRDLIRRRRITPEEAEALLAQFDAGIPLQLPVETEGDADEWLAAFALLLLLVRGSPRRILTPQRKERARRLLRGAFDARMGALAMAVASGELSTPAWYAQTAGALARYTRQMAIAGRGRLPSAGMEATIEERLGEQWPFLDRFAVEQMAREAGGRPMSERAIAARSRMYGGIAWSAFFQAQGEDAQPGMVEQYITRDDGAVCRLCAPRHLQYFLPGQGPMPGQCLGVCRCVRVPQYNPDVYAQLTGQRSAQRQAA